MAIRAGWVWGVAAAFGLALVGCGGHIAGVGEGEDSGTDSEGDTDTDSGVVPDTDTGIDTGYDVPCTTESPCIDTGVRCPPVQPPEGSACAGSETCVYETKCAKVIEQCVYGRWTNVGGSDAGCGDCPPSIPYGYTPCSIDGQRCNYSTCPDGSTNVDALCKGGVWNVSTGPCAAPFCPPSEPPVGSPCSPGSPKCDYANACGGRDYLYCGPSGWASAGSDCGTPTCPISEPPIGSFCGSTPMKCMYPNSCGGSDFVVCAGGGRWELAGSSCSGPTCPPGEPAPGTPCSGAAKCPYPNSCGGTDVMVCGGWGSWYLGDRTCSGGSCPPFMPASGSSCAGYPGGTTCNYPPGSPCPEPCVCGADGRWTCYVVLCDAGPPPPPPPPPPSDCSEGWPCAPGTGCGITCVRSCYCGADGRYHCTPSPCP